MNAAPQQERLYAHRNKTVAKSFYRHLRTEGFTHQQIIALSTELLELVTDDMRDGGAAEAR